MPERLLSRPINSTADVFRKIVYPSEQQIALHFLRRLPNIRLTYEPGEFHATEADGTIRTTIPDFLIEYLNTGKKVYVEITAKKHGVNDPKERQKWVMEHAAPNDNYVVLYRSSLERIQAKYPEVHIFPYKGNVRRKS